MSLESVQKYIRIEQIGLSKSGKTKIYGVFSSADDQIGIIRWHGAWRKYVYESTESFYDWDCLRLIAQFIELATKEQMMK